MATSAQEQTSAPSGRPHSAVVSPDNWKKWGPRMVNADHVFHVPMTRILAVLLEDVDSTVSFSSATSILDIACGSGFAFEGLFNSGYSMPASVSLTGTDISPARLKQLDNIRNAAPPDSLWPRVQTYETDAKVMPMVATGSQSHVLSSMGIFVVPDLEAAFKEARRVMVSSGGVFGMTALQRSSWIDEMFPQIAVLHPEVAGKIFKPNPFWTDHEAIRQLLEKCGFRNVKLREVEADVAFEEAEAIVDVLWKELPFVPLLSKDWSEHEVERVKDHLVGFVKERYPDGKMKGSFVVIVAQ